MSKLVSSTLATTGAATTSIAGAYLIQKIQVKPDELDEFKKDNTGDECVKNVFTSVSNLSDLKDSKQITEDNLKSDTSFFGNKTNDANTLKSCLSINVDKKEYTVNSDTKWTGKFTWSWSFINNDKGFITFNVSKSSSSDKQLNVIGGFYLLSKESDGWKVKYHKEVRESDNKKISDSNFDNTFPKPKTSSATLKDGWSFIDNKDKLKEICGDGACTGDTTPKTTNTKWSWKWTNNGNDKVGEWSDNWKWFELIYVKDDFNLEDKLKEFSGTWTKDNPTPAA